MDGTGTTYSVPAQTFLRRVKDYCYQFSEMTVPEDFARVVPGNPDCQYGKYEVERLEHLQNALSSAEDQLESIYDSEKSIISGRLYPHIEKLKTVLECCRTVIKSESGTSKNIEESDSEEEPGEQETETSDEELSDTEQCVYTRSGRRTTTWKTRANILLYVKY